MALLRGSIDVLDNIDASELDSVRGKPGIRVEMTTAMDNYVLLLQTSDAGRSITPGDRSLHRTEELARVGTHGTARSNNSPIPSVSPYYKARRRSSSNPISFAHGKW